jgi:hypothetical protein
MGKKSQPDPPEPPNPQAVASAQTGTNIGTAVANSLLNNVNQIGPDGNLSYTIDGYTDWQDPTSKKIYKIPRWVQTTQLSEGQQKLYDLNQGTETELAGMAGEQAKRLRGLLSEPVSLDNQAVEQRLFDLADKRFAPQKQRELADMQTSLTNQGITQGSEAYDRAMGRFNEGWNDRYNQLALTGRGQAVQEALTARNQPLNEIIGIMSGTQVGLPQFSGGTNNYGIPTTDYAGIVNNNYAQQMAGYNAQMASQQAGMGALGNLFGTLGSVIPKFAALSDKRAKENIKEVGKTNDGQKIYSYNYKGDNKPQMGLIAQDVKRRNPDAVIRDKSSGFLMVDYGKALKNSEPKRSKRRA